MAIEVYFNFNGNCREVVEFYSKAFNVPMEKIMTFGEMPPDPANPIPEAAKNLVLHTYLMIGGSRVMFSDTFPGMPYSQGNNISVTYMGENEDEIREIFHRLKEGGTVDMELQQTFWSKCYGMVTDKFGIHWQLSLESGM